MLPKINSSHGSETRNIINAAIDAINVQGKTIQDLVAEGQLTPAQYNSLIQMVNGLIAKGEVSVHDIDVNKGKLLPKHLSQEVLEMMTGDAPVNAIPAEGSLTTGQYADKSVTPNKTTFIKQTKNLWDGEYYPWYIIGSQDSYRLVREFDGLSNGVVVMAPIKPGLSYTIKVHEEHLANRFMVASSKNHPGNFIERFVLDTVLAQNQSIKELTFNNSAGDNWLYIMVSNNNQKPKIQIEEGLEASEYTVPYLFPKEFIMPEIKDEIKGMDNTVTLIEDISNGYPPRTNATSVIWIGPNEPAMAEPFDEWREVEGYTYYTDFSDYTNQQLQSEWTKRWRDGVMEIVNDPTAPSGEKTLAFNPSSHGYYALSWDVLENDDRKSDAEVFLRGRSTNSFDVQSLSVVIRGKDDETGYVIGARSDGNLRISRYSNGATSTLANVQTDVNFLEYYNLLVRIDDGRIRMKCWQYEDKEPGWSADIEDEMLFEEGFIGVYNFQSGFNAYIDSVGIGTGGMRAPRRRRV